MEKISIMNFKEINQKNRIVLFGAGYIAEKTFKKIMTPSIRVVDNSINMQGSARAKLGGAVVESPSSLSVNDFVIICSTALDAIRNQLTEIGLKENENFSASPLLDNYIAIEKLEKFNCRFIFSSGSAPASNYGGGLYLGEVSKGDFKFKRLHSGFTYGMVQTKYGVYFVDTDEGIFQYDDEKGIVSKIADLPADSRAHGISYNEDYDHFYVSCSNLDAVIEFSSDFRELRRFSMSGKKVHTGNPHHHINDNCSYGDSLFVSMFSSTGNWKEGIFDGVVTEFCLKEGVRKTDVIRNLYMPHNVVNLNDGLCVLDSLRGHLLASNGEVSGTFPGFTRGVDFDGELYLIGQSKNRNYSKVVGLSNNISIDCSIILFDPKRKVSRSFQLPLGIGEIHSIKVLE